MKQGMSKREKILIFSLGVIVVFYLSIQFAILPLMSAALDNNREINYLRDEKALVEYNAANSELIRIDNSIAIQQFNEIKQEYPLLVPNEEIHTILTNLCRINNLSPDGLRITPPKSNDTDDDGQDIFTVVNASMNLTGSFNNLLKLIEEVNKIQYIHIGSLSYAANRTEGTWNDDSIVISFEMTFINP